MMHVGTILKALWRFPFLKNENGWSFWLNMGGPFEQKQVPLDGAPEPLCSENRLYVFDH